MAEYIPNWKIEWVKHSLDSEADSKDAMSFLECKFLYKDYYLFK